jgi:hypothetical protein
VKQREMTQRVVLQRAVGLLPCPALCCVQARITNAARCTQDAAEEQRRTEQMTAT